MNDGAHGQPPSSGFHPNWSVLAAELMIPKSPKSRDNGVNINE